MVYEENIFKVRHPETWCNRDQDIKMFLLEYFHKIELTKVEQEVQLP